MIDTKNLLSDEEMDKVAGGKMLFEYWKTEKGYEYQISGDEMRGKGCIFEFGGFDGKKSIDEKVKKCEVFGTVEVKQLDGRPAGFAMNKK